MIISANTLCGKIDVDLNKAAQLLVKYGVASQNASVLATMLLTTDSVEEFEGEMRRRHLSADLEQCLLPAFRMLYMRNVAIRAEVFNELFGLASIPDDVLASYFLEMGNQPYIKLWRDYGKDQPKGWADEFIAGARHTIFKNIRGAIVAYGFVKPLEKV